MKIRSTFLPLVISMSTVSLALGQEQHAQPEQNVQQGTLPTWLQLTWTKAKFTDAKSADAKSADAKSADLPAKRSNRSEKANLAPVETAVPKLNEKHLTADELKALRRQLRQQR